MSIRAYPFGTEYPPKALDATLQALADLSTSANTAPYFTAIDQAAMMTVTPFGRSLIAQTDSAGLKAAIDFGSGVANRVALWADTDTLTSDPELYYDLTTNRLGIGTATPTAPLTFSQFSGHKIYLLDPGGSNNRYGLGIGGAVTQIFAPSNGAIDLGTISTTDGTTFTNTVQVGATGVSMLGFLSCQQTLYVAGTSQLAGNVGIGVAAGTAPLAFANSVGRKIHLFGTTYGMEVQNLELRVFAYPGAQITLGGMDAAVPPVYTPLMNLHTSTMRVGINYGVTAPGHTVDVNGDVGIATTLLVQGATTLNSTLSVANSAYFASVVGIAGAPDGSWNLRNYGSTYLASLNVGGNTTLTGIVGMGGAPNSAYGLTNNGSSYLYGLVGVGTIPYAGWALAAGSIVNWGAQHIGGTLNVIGSSAFTGVVGMGRASDPGWSLCVGSLFSDGQIRGSSLYTWGNLTSEGTIIGSGVYGVLLNGVAGSSPIVVNGLRGNPSWSTCHLDFYHYPGSHVSFFIQTEAGGANYYDMRLSGGNAYIGQGGWIDAPSDRRLKRDIHSIDVPLERLAKLHGSHYERTDVIAQKGFPAPKTQEYGLIAQDVAAALPDAAFEHDYGKRGVLWNYYDRPVLALLVESVKALAQRLEALEQRG